jgi:hypothetical protein
VRSRTSDAITRVLRTAKLDASLSSWTGTVALRKRHAVAVSAVAVRACWTAHADARAAHAVGVAVPIDASVAGRAPNSSTRVGGADACANAGATTARATAARPRRASPAGKRRRLVGRVEVADRPGVGDEHRPRVVTVRSSTAVGEPLLSTARENTQREHDHPSPLHAPTRPFDRQNTGNTSNDTARCGAQAQRYFLVILEFHRTVIGEVLAASRRRSARCSRASAGQSVSRISRRKNPKWPMRALLRCSD